MAHRKPSIDRTINASRRARRTTATGFTAIDMVVVVAIIATIGGMAVPPVLSALDDLRTVAAARFISTQLQKARMEAIVRSRAVAVRFRQLSDGYTFAFYVDGNGNGVLSDDIARGIDPQLGAVERLSHNFAGVEFGTLAGLPSVDKGGVPPGNDPIRLGVSDAATFTADGTSSSGSVYIRGRHTQMVVRIYGDTGKTRLLKFNPRTFQWRPL